jgi:hypothetical protein
MVNENPGCMEMPVQCDCGKWMELNDSWPSAHQLQVGVNVTACNGCREKEEAENERQEEIEDLQNTIDDAEYTLKVAKERLAVLQAA